MRVAISCVGIAFLSAMIEAFDSSQNDKLYIVSIILICVKFEK